MAIYDSTSNREYNRLSLMNQISKRCKLDGFCVERTGLIWVPSSVQKRDPTILGKFLDNILETANKVVMGAETNIPSFQHHYTPFIAKEDEMYKLNLE